VLLAPLYDEQVFEMEVTNNNSTTFAPKLGSVSQGSISNDAFSSHLQEATPNPRPRSEERNVQNDDRTTTSDRAEAADDRREAQSREADAEARDKEHEQTEAESNSAAASDNENEDTALQTTSAENTVLENGIASAIEGDSSAEIAPEFSDDLEATAVTDTTDAQTSQTSGFGDTESATTHPDTAATSNLNADEELIVANNNGTSQAVASQETAAQETAKVANAAHIASTEAANTSAEKPVANATANATSTNATSNATAENPTGVGAKEDGLPNPLGASSQGDADTGSQGEKGLGQQAAEAMANKNNTIETTQPNNAAAKISTQASATTVSPVQVQALTSLGLNASALPADLDVDLLGLNTTNPAPGGSSTQNTNATLVRFGALPGQAQATQVPNTAIALQIAKHVSKGVSTFEIRVDPPEMGRIDVKLQLAQDGRVTVHLAVEKSETLDLLQRDAKALEQALKDAGLDVDSDALSFSLQDGNASNEFGSAAGEDGELNANDDQNNDAQDDALVTAMAARQINAAARGGIDVSI
jgi:flagellar hook-length control protein FliK